MVGRDQVFNLDAYSCVRRFGKSIHSLQIRTAKAADLSAIEKCLDLAFNSFAGHTDGGDAKLANNLQSQILDGSIQLICDGNSVLGYVAIWPAGGQMFVDTLAVVPTHRRQGLGSQLLAFAESEARRLGLETVNLFTKATMVGNLEFYRRRGYIETGRCDDDGFCRVFYTKHVSAVTAATIAATGQRM